MPIPSPIARPVRVSPPLTTILIILIGSTVKINSAKEIEMLFITFLISDLFLMINKHKNPNKTNSPSDLTRDARPIAINEMYVFLFPEKNNHKDIEIKNMNRGSVVPKKEFWMILGSNAKNTEQIIAYLFSKNFFPSK